MLAFLALLWLALELRTVDNVGALASEGTRTAPATRDVDVVSAERRTQVREVCKDGAKKWCFLKVLPAGPHLGPGVQLMVIATVADLCRHLFTLAKPQLNGKMIYEEFPLDIFTLWSPTTIYPLGNLELDKQCG